MRVVYIMGYGHSGSTILDAMLGEAEGVEGVGELANLISLGWRENRRKACACGSPVETCPFWRAVHETWARATGETDFARFAALRAPLRRSTGRGTHASRPEDAPAFAEFRRLAVALYRSIADVSGRSVVVDSSKAPWRARLLSQIPELDLRVLHLVRDGRAVAWSLRRKNASVLRTATAWRLHNFHCDEVRRSLPADRTALVRYEDLVFRTRDTLRGLETRLGIDLEPLAGRVARSEPIRFRHEIGGNRVRRTRATPLRPDVAWSRDMPQRWREMVWLLARKPLRAYGYERRA